MGVFAQVDVSCGAKRVNAHQQLVRCGAAVVEAVQPTRHMDTIPEGSPRPPKPIPCQRSSNLTTRSLRAKLLPHVSTTRRKQSFVNYSSKHIRPRQSLQCHAVLLRCRKVFFTHFLIIFLFHLFYFFFLFFEFILSEVDSSNVVFY